jgi:hypothetical protein
VLEVERQRGGKKKRNDRVFAVPNRSPLEADLKDIPSSALARMREARRFFRAPNVLEKTRSRNSWVGTGRTARSTDTFLVHYKRKYDDPVQPRPYGMSPGGSDVLRRLQFRRVRPAFFQIRGGEMHGPAFPRAEGVLRAAETLAVAPRLFVVHQGAFYQVFMFAESTPRLSATSSAASGLHPSEKGKEPIGRNGRTGTVTLGNDIAGSSFLNFSINFNAAVRQITRGILDELETSAGQRARPSGFSNSIRS